MKNEENTDNQEPAGFALRRVFFSYIHKVSKKVSQHPNYKPEENNYDILSSNQKLSFRIVEYTSKLNGLLSDLNKTHVFIRRFSDKKYMEKNEISNLSYIKYHYEVFMHKIHTILEVMKLAVNDIYEIKLPPKDCTWDNLKNNPIFKHTKTKLIIEAYFFTFEHIIKHRHLNTHRAYFGDKTNKDLSVQYNYYRDAEEYGFELQDDPLTPIRKDFLNQKVFRYRKERLKYIEEGTEIAKKYVYDFESILINEFMNKFRKNI